jgi:protein-disulfide isomerase
VEKQVIQEIVDAGLAYYVFYQFPFLDDRSASKDSDRSANAALCAADQNRFWEYKNMLFANQTSVEEQFNDKRLLAFAEYLGLDMEQFEACYKENRFQNQINDDLALGREMGITGTPTVFVNGVDVSPGRVPTFEQILQAVQAATGN